MHIGANIEPHSTPLLNTSDLDRRVNFFLSASFSHVQGLSIYQTVLYLIPIPLTSVAVQCVSCQSLIHKVVLTFSSIVNCIATDETDFNEALEPQLTSMQQLLVIFCHRLTSSHHPTLIETLLKTIEWNLFICEDRTKEVGSTGKKTKAQKARLQAELQVRLF